MKPVFKCDYCDFMSTEEKVKEHEPTCTENYDRKSCWTCQHRGNKSLKQFSCACGQEIPENKIFEFCPKYERKEKSEYHLTDIFGGLFGGTI